MHMSCFPLLQFWELTAYIIQCVESPLRNLREGDNYEDMCYSTPAFLFGQAYQGPNAGCVDWVCAVTVAH
jgi:hypothetical protein